MFDLFSVRMAPQDFGIFTVYSCVYTRGVHFTMEILAIGALLYICIYIYTYTRATSYAVALRGS